MDLLGLVMGRKAWSEGKLAVNKPMVKTPGLFNDLSITEEQPNETPSVPGQKAQAAGLADRTGTATSGTARPAASGVR